MPQIIKLDRHVLIDLFCGIGGVSCGFSQFGFEVVLAMDTWEQALRVHTIKYPKALHSSMQLGTSEAEQFIFDVIAGLGLSDGDHLHVHASPPCHLISSVNLAGTRNPNAGMVLVEWSFKLLDKIKRTTQNNVHVTWTIEEVNHPLIRQFCVSNNISFNVYNTSEYGVCQKRKRLVMTSIDITETMKTKCSYPCKSIEDIVELPEATKYISNFVYGPNRKPSAFKVSFIEIVPKKTVAYTVVQSSGWFLGENKRPLRSFSWHDNMLLQSFPNDYINMDMKIKRIDLFKMIANAVPPNFAKCLAKAIVIKSGL